MSVFEIHMNASTPWLPAQKKRNPPELNFFEKGGVRLWDISGSCIDASVERLISPASNIALVVLPFSFITERNKLVTRESSGRKDAREGRG